VESRNYHKPSVIKAYSGLVFFLRGAMVGVDLLRFVDGKMVQQITNRRELFKDTKKIE